MGNEQGEIWWYDPDPRTILPLETFHVPRSLTQRIRRGGFEVRLDTAFRSVITTCAEPAPNRKSTWITPPIIDAYCALHELGVAHSVETWMDNQLVGGLYGVAVGGLFAGESMFSRVTDASKIALVYLVEQLRAGGFVLHDTQFMTPHLKRFGAVEISRNRYKRALRQALLVEARFNVGR
jgi:leucyl/phenylalanyl-tRNA--protein transferase